MKAPEIHCLVRADLCLKAGLLHCGPRWWEGKGAYSRFLGAEPLCLRPNTVPLVLGSDIQPFFISLLFEDVEVYSIAKRIK